MTRTTEYSCVTHFILNLNTETGRIIRISKVHFPLSKSVLVTTFYPFGLRKEYKRELLQTHSNDLRYILRGPDVLILAGPFSKEKGPARIETSGPEYFAI